MAEPAATSDTVLRKMLRPPPRAIGPMGAALERLAEDLFRRSAKAVHDLDILVPERQAHLVSPEEAIAERPDPSMTVVVSAGDGSSVGFVNFDALLIDALIEMQTVGRLLDLERLDRPVTDIDCAMAEPFLADILARLSNSADADPVLSGLRGLQMRHVERDAIQLGLDLQAASYERLQLQLDLGPGEKSGRVQIVLPAARAASAEAGTKRRNPKILAAIKSHKLALQAVLPPLELSVRDLKGMKVGDCFSVPRGHLSSVELCVDAGTPLTLAQLGQLDGYRAVRIGTSAATNAAPATFIQTGAAPAARTPVPDAVPPATQTVDQTGGAAPDGDRGLETGSSAPPEQGDPPPQE